MNNPIAQLVADAQAEGPRAVRAAARLMSIVTDQPQRLGELLARCRHWPQPSLILGVTGAPGSGKSTLVDHIVAEYRRRWPERRLGIVAVDPSSPFTGGALLGDRVRMMRHATDPGVFIRSLASRGHLGGLALGAQGVVRIMGLAGCDVVVVETVGVGQSEVEIAQQADLTLVVLAPGQGDSIQMLKAGLIEAGDLFVINKADRPDASRLHQQLVSALHLGRRSRAGAALTNGAPQACHDPAHRSAEGADADDAVFLTSAVNHDGVAELVDELQRRTAQSLDRWRDRRRQQTADEVRRALLHEVEQRVAVLLDRTVGGAGPVDRVLAGDASLHEVADEMLRQAVARQGTTP